MSNTLLKLISLVAFISIILMTTACKSVLKVTGNYKKPQKESAVSIVSYLEVQHALYDEAYIPKSKLGLKYILDSINGFMPSIIVFDKDYKNYILDYKCFSAKPTGLDSLMKSGAWKRDSSSIYQRLSAQISLINAPSKDPINNKEIYVFYFWAKYLPKKSNEMIQENAKLFTQFHKSIYVASVNLDLQGSWE